MATLPLKKAELAAPMSSAPWDVDVPTVGGSSATARPPLDAVDLRGLGATYDITVPMRDGVRLATDVYHCQADKDAGVARPVILFRTPYNKGLGPPVEYAREGYVVVTQDIRGRFGSGGRWSMLTTDGPDAQDTCRWLIEQPWCDGSIGMIGTSYCGATQHTAAMMGESGGCPGLKAIIPVDAMCNMGHAGIRNGGAFELRFWNWIFGASTTMGAPWGSRQSRDAPTAAVLQKMANERLSYLKHLPLRMGHTPLQLAPEYEEWLVEAMSTGGNTEFWTSYNSILDHPESFQRDCACYLVGGWYDSWA